MHTSHSVFALVLGLIAPLAAGQTCNSDNVYRALINAGTSASTFCSTYVQATATSGYPYPTYISAYSTAPARISSACTCINNAPSPTCNPGRLYGNVVPNRGFDRLDTTKPRNAQATPWVPIAETNAVVQYVPVQTPQSQPNAAAFYFYETPSSSGGSATLETTVTLCNGRYYGLNYAFRFQPDQARNGTCRAVLAVDYFPVSLATDGGFYVSNTSYFYGTGQNLYLNGAPTNAKGQVIAKVRLTVSCHLTGTAQIDDVAIDVGQPA